MRFGAFEVDCVFQPSFVLAEVLCGRARIIRTLRIRNVRGTIASWLKISLEIGGRRIRQKAVRNLPVGDDAAAGIMESSIREALNVPESTPPGVYSARLLISDEDGENEWPFSFRVLTPLEIPTDFARAVFISAYVRNGDALRAFDAEVLGEKEDAGALRKLYRALRARGLSYHPVALVHEADTQETADPAYVLLKGGSCADLSLLFASLMYVWGIPPALLLFRDHMAAGCFDPDRLPSQETLTGNGEIMRLMDQGILTAVECTRVCLGLESGFDEARDLVIRRLQAGEPCVMVNVLNALRGGVVPVWQHTAPPLRCPVCGFDRLGENADACPCCGHRLTAAPVLPPSPAADDPIPFSPFLSYGVAQGGAVILRVKDGEQTVRIPPVWQGRTVLRIGDRALEGCGAGRVLLPDSVTHIGDYAFSGCRELTALALPENLCFIGTGAFSGSGLSEITIPAGVKRIPRMAFAGCAALEKLSLPQGLTDIDEKAFRGCEKLRWVHLPASVRRVARDAFDPGCELAPESSRTVII